MFFGNMLAKANISQHVTTYCNEILINCNNTNKKFDQLLTSYCNSDTIETLSSIVVENQNIQSKLKDGLVHSEEVKYTCKYDKTINLINNSQFIATWKQFNCLTETMYVFRKYDIEK